MPDDLTLGHAAKALGVSADTLRRWERQGRLQTVRDAANRRRVPPTEVERLAGRPARHPSAVGRVTSRAQLAGALPSPQRVDADADGTRGVAQQQSLVLRHCLSIA